MNVVRSMAGFAFGALSKVSCVIAGHVTESIRRRNRHLVVPSVAHRGRVRYSFSDFPQT